MSAKVFYLEVGISSNVHQRLTEITPAPNFTISPNYGWTTGTIVIDRWASADAQTVVPAASFSATPQPDGSIVTTQGAGDCWRTPVPLHGNFDAGTWTFQLSAVQGGGGVNGQGRGQFRLFKSSNSDGSGATELTSAIVDGSIIAIGIIQTNSIGTVSLGAISLTDEYLFVQVGWKITTVATGMTASTFAVLMRSGPTASQLNTPNFVQTVGMTEWRESGNCTNVAGSDVDWTSPGNAQISDGDVAQFINTFLSFEQFSDYLNADTFGFTADLQPTDTITGIKFLSDYNTDIATGISLISVLLVINGSTVGADKGDDSDFPTTMTIKLLGGVGDLWSAGPLSGTDLRLSNSGVRIQAVSHTGLGARGRVDQIAMKIYYDRVQNIRSGVALSGGASMSF